MHFAPLFTGKFNEVPQNHQVYDVAILPVQELHYVQTVRKIIYIDLQMVNYIVKHVKQHLR